MPRHDDDSDEDPWEDKSVRRAFIAKVTFILMVQLSITTIITATFILSEGAQAFLRKNFWLMLVAAGACLVISIALFCCYKIARLFPINYILLFIFTICKSIVISYLAIRFAPIQVLTALGITVLLCLSLMLFAIFAPCDFTGCGVYLCIGSIILLLMSVAAIFIKGKIIIWIIACFGLFLFSMYLIYDIQLMVGGKHKNQYSEEDYVIAALSIYIDVVHIFMYILIILGLCQD